MVRGKRAITPDRFARGMTFDQYLSYVGTPENLAREAGWWLGPERRDFSGLLRSWYDRCSPSDAQVAAIRWLAAQPKGPANIVVISEEWSSDCRRDVPMLARVAEAGGLTLRIFPRTGWPAPCASPGPARHLSRAGTVSSVTGPRCSSRRSSSCGHAPRWTRSSPRSTSGSSSGGVPRPVRPENLLRPGGPGYIWTVHEY